MAEYIANTQREITAASFDEDGNQIAQPNWIPSVTWTNQEGNFSLGGYKGLVNQITGKIPTELQCQYTGYTLSISSINPILSTATKVKSNSIAVMRKGDHCTCTGTFTNSGGSQPCNCTFTITNAGQQKVKAE